MILELVFEWRRQDAEAQKQHEGKYNSSTEQQVSKILVQHCAAPWPLMGYSSSELSIKFPGLKCNCAAAETCTQSVDLVGNEF